MSEQPTGAQEFYAPAPPVAPVTEPPAAEPVPADQPVTITPVEPEPVPTTPVQDGSESATGSGSPGLAPPPGDSPLSEDAATDDEAEAEPFRADEPEVIPPPQPGVATATANETPPAPQGPITAADTHPGVLVRLKDVLGMLENFWARNPHLRGNETELKSNLSTLEKQNGPAE